LRNISDYYFAFIFKAKKRRDKNIKSANSGDVTGDKDKVVGYVSALAYLPEDATKTKNKSGAIAPKEEAMQSFTLNNNEKKELLDVARKPWKVICMIIESLNLKLPLKCCMKTRRIRDPKKNGELRGCIGRIVADTPLYEVVANVAVDSAINDPRLSR